MRELSNMLAKEFWFKTLKKYNKITIQSDNDDEDDENVNDDDDESNNVEIQVGDYVMVIHEPFRGYFAVVTDKSYGDEFEIQYFQKKREMSWSLLKEELMKVLIIFSNYNFSQNISWRSV